MAPHEGGPAHHNLRDAMVELDGVRARDVLDVDALGYVYDALPVPAEILAGLRARNDTRAQGQGAANSSHHHHGRRRRNDPGKCSCSCWPVKMCSCC